MEGKASGLFHIFRQRFALLVMFDDIPRYIQRMDFIGITQVAPGYDAHQCAPDGNFRKFIFYDFHELIEQFRTEMSSPGIEPAQGVTVFP